MAVGTPIAASEEELAQVKYDDHGLVTAIVQEQSSGDILQVAYMNAATLRQTLETGAMTYWSRSRQEVWIKGETSGDRQWLREAYYDCDGDALLFKVVQDGRGACHTGDHSCFHRPFGSGSDVQARS
jgi:phosphoribosyl-AMP cyclohydrolase